MTNNQLFRRESRKAAKRKNSGMLVLQDIRRLIESARYRTVQYINAELTMLYWKVVERIRREVLKEIADQLSEAKTLTEIHELLVANEEFKDMTLADVRNDYMLASSVFYQHAKVISFKRKAQITLQRNGSLGGMDLILEHYGSVLSLGRTRAGKKREIWDAVETMGTERVFELKMSTQQLEEILGEYDEDRVDDLFSLLVELFEDGRHMQKDLSFEPLIEDLVRDYSFLSIQHIKNSVSSLD